MRNVAILAAVLTTVGAHSGPRLTLTAHVPDAVARHAVAVIGAPAATSTMELAISLPLHNEVELRARLDDMYNPKSTSYRHYFSVADFTQRYAPSAAEYQSLLQFALAKKLHPRRMAANRRVLDVQGTVADIERAFHVKIGLYKHPTEQRTFFAPDREPTTDLDFAVLHISGLDNFVLPSSHLVRGSGTEAGASAPTGSGPKGNFIGSDIRAAYYGGTALTGTGQSLGLFEYAGYNLTDVKNYFAKVGQRLSVPIVGVSLNGANLDCSGKCDDSEQVLDMEEAISMAPGLKQVVVYVGNSDVSIMNQMASDDTSKQLSTSWGWNPNPVELDPIFLEFAAQGQTMLVATGDYGYQLKKGAVWPADDRFVTAVGGTDLATDGPGGVWKSEVGWKFSGGGPSPDQIAIPSYQLPFINTRNDGSRNLRNVPDIAGDSNTDNFSCYDGGCSTGNGGTSYAAPIWAGYIALANQLADALNRPPVGFLNPTVYAIGGSTAYDKLFHDQIFGYNGKYIAGRGFDLVTGFGSPRGEALVDALARGK